MSQKVEDTLEGKPAVLETDGKIAIVPEPPTGTQTEQSSGEGGPVGG